MNKEQILSFLHLLGVQASAEQSRGGWVVSKCPMGPWRHNNGTSLPGAFGVKIEQGDSFCNCFSCDWHGKQSDLVTEMRMLQNKQPKPLKKYQFSKAMEMVFAAEEGAEIDFDTPGIEDLLFNKPKTVVFDEEWLSTFSPAWAFEEARKYLRSRQIGEEASAFFDIRFDTKKRRICFPIRDFKNQLRGLHGRAIDKDATLRYLAYTPKEGGNKLMNPLIWLGEHYVDTELPIVIVEGPIDVASVWRVYRNVVSPLYANPSIEKLKRMSDALVWVTLLDHGGGGDHGRTKITKAMAKQAQVIHCLPFEGKDPGSMTAHEIATILGEYLPLDDFID